MPLIRKQILGVLDFRFHNYWMSYVGIQNSAQLKKFRNPALTMDVQRPSISMNKIVLGKAFAYTIPLQFYVRQCVCVCACVKVLKGICACRYFICMTLYDHMHAHLNSYTLPSPSVHMHRYIGDTLRPRQCQYIHTTLRMYIHTHTYTCIYTDIHYNISSAAHST